PDRGARVTRHLDLGNHLDVPRRRVAHNLDVVRMRKEPAAPWSIDQWSRSKRGLKMPVRVRRVAASGSDRRQLGQTRDLDAPAFIVGEVDVKDIELVAREEIERAQHDGL